MNNAASLRKRVLKNLLKRALALVGYRVITHGGYRVLVPLKERPVPSADGTTNAAWAALTERTVAEIGGVDEIYRPTSFWEPALKQLLAAENMHGLENFKSWTISRTWFYPRYAIVTAAREAARDFDAIRLAWDQHRWPFDLTGFGESPLGNPPEYFRLTDAEHGWTRPYLNYLLCLTALSRHIEAAPKSFLEIGGGFGVLGEILLSRDPDARYVNLDIPPLLTVASYYLKTLFGDRVVTYDADLPAAGELKLKTSAVLPNWRIKDVRGDFDVFVNAFSFQEMEPNVVEHYIDAVAEAGVEYVVSLNSRKGKQKVEERGNRHWGGVIEPVTSQLIVDLFGARGYELQGRYERPLIHSGGELVVLRKI